MIWILITNGRFMFRRTKQRMPSARRKPSAAVIDSISFIMT